MPRMIGTARTWLLALVAVLGACGSWNVNAPAPPFYEGMQLGSRPRALVDVITIGKPPTIERAYEIMIARCQAAEREKSRALIGYGITRWSTLATALLASSAAVALTAINEPNSSRYSPQMASNLRISSIALGSLGAVLGTIHGLAGFDTRIDAQRKDLVALRAALDRARSVWPFAADAEKRQLMETMAVTCNKEQLVEAIITAATGGQIGLLATKLDQTIDLVDQLIKAMTYKKHAESPVLKGKLRDSLLGLAASAADAGQGDLRAKAAQMVPEVETELSSSTPNSDAFQIKLQSDLEVLKKLRASLPKGAPQSAPGASANSASTPADSPPSAPPPAVDTKTNRAVPVHN